MCTRLLGKTIRAKRIEFEGIGQFFQISELRNPSYCHAFPFSDASGISRPLKLSDPAYILCKPLPSTLIGNNKWPWCHGEKYETYAV